MKINPTSIVVIIFFIVINTHIANAKTIEVNSNGSYFELLKEHSEEINNIKGEIKILSSKIDENLSLGLNYITIVIGSISLISGIITVLYAIFAFKSRSSIQKLEKELKDSTEKYQNEINLAKENIYKNKQEIENTKANAVAAQEEVDKILKNIHVQKNFDTNVVENLEKTTKIQELKNTFLISLALKAHENECWDEAFVLWKTSLSCSPEQIKSMTFYVYSGLKLFIKHHKNINFYYILEEIDPFVIKIQNNVSALSTVALYHSICFEVKQEGKNDYFEKANKDFAIATRFEPNILDTWLNWGNIIMKKAFLCDVKSEKKQLLNDTFDKITIANEIQRDTAIVLMKLGEIKLYMYDVLDSLEEKSITLESAQNYLHQSLRISKDVATYNILGKLYLKQAQQQQNDTDKLNLLIKAKETFSQSIDVDGTYLDSIASFAAVNFTLYQLSNDNAKIKYLTDARDSFTLLKSLCPNELFVYFGLAKVEFCAKNNETAVQYLYKAKEISYELAKKLFDNDDFFRTLKAEEVNKIFTY